MLGIARSTMQQKIKNYDIQGSVLEIPTLEAVQNEHIRFVAQYCRGDLKEASEFLKIPQEKVKKVLGTSGANLPTLAQAEKEAILKALQLNDWIIRQTAKDLGIASQSLSSKMARYKIRQPK